MAAESTHYDVDGPWTPLQIAFVAAYFEAEGNKTEAARLAGSKSKEPKRIGWELAQLEHVKKAIAKETPKRASKFAEDASLELLQKLRRWLYADRSAAYDSELEVLPTTWWPDELREILVGVSAQTTADGTVIRSPKFASLETLVGQFTRALELALSRTGPTSAILATPAEVARIQELRSATFDRIQGAIADALKQATAEPEATSSDIE